MLCRIDGKYSVRSRSRENIKVFPPPAEIKCTKYSLIFIGYILDKAPKLNRKESEGLALTADTKPAMPALH
ncbi:MAG: hypothetical protein DBX36_02700 [Oscillospiraceae bacterium]|nr:MAG: hypothetical protein DBX36_02700 [Oscillospiraceae bacterium]